MNRSLIVASVVLLFLSLFIYAEGAREGEGEPSAIPADPLQLTVAGLKGPSSIGMLQMMESQPEFGAGVEAEYQIVDEPQLMIARIMSGEADIAAVPINLAAVLYNKGAPYRLGAVTGDGLLHVVSSRDDIRSVEDLKGKRIYCIAQGSTPEFVLRYVLEENGIDPDTDVELDFSFDHVAIAPQLIAGKVDLAVLPEPFVSIVASKNPEVEAVIDLQEVWAEVSGLGDAYPITATLVRSSLYEEHPQVLEALFAAYRDSIDWANANPADAGVLAGTYMQMPAPIIAQAMPRLNLRFQLPDEARSRVEELYQVFYGFAPASVGGTIPGDEFYGE